MSLPPEAFSPPPKVNSAVVHFEALTLPRFPAPAKLLSSTVAMAFNQRRKMLRSSLKSAAPNIERILHDAGLDPTARAEEVSLEQFCALARQLADY
jgi:16S rRNA (adenine1518-N6/adenine1519-N6)-dimethyltransferase